jgi:hypothetical protein
VRVVLAVVGGPFGTMDDAVGGPAMLIIGGPAPPDADSLSLVEYHRVSTSKNDIADSQETISKNERESFSKGFVM